MSIETIDRSKYGAFESNGLVDAEAYLATIDFSEPVWLDDPRLARIIRLRLISDPGFPFWDVSYAHGELKDGTRVRVNLPSTQLTKRYLKRDLVAMAKSVGVYAKGLGLLDDGVISKLH